MENYFIIIIHFVLCCSLGYRASWKTRFNNAGFALLFNVRNIKKNRSVLHTPPPTLSHGVGIGRGKNDNTSTIQLGGIRDVGAPVTLCLKCQSNHGPRNEITHKSPQPPTPLTLLNIPFSDTIALNLI